MVSRIVLRRSGVAARGPSSLVDCREHNVLSANTLMLGDRLRLTAVTHLIIFAGFDPCNKQLVALKRAVSSYIKRSFPVEGRLVSQKSGIRRFPI